MQFRHQQETQSPLSPYTTSSCRIMKTTSDKLHPGALTMIIFRVLFADMALKVNLITLGQPFQVSIHVHPLQKTTRISFDA